ncbi:MAG: hypothetical protein WBP03_01820, partial [Candidatus Saccharimonadales bacterium]
FPSDSLPKLNPRGRAAGKSEDYLHKTIARPVGIRMGYIAPAIRHYQASISFVHQSSLVTRDS